MTGDILCSDQRLIQGKCQNRCLGWLVANIGYHVDFGVLLSGPVNQAQQCFGKAKIQTLQEITPVFRNHRSCSRHLQNLQIPISVIAFFATTEI